MELSWTTFILEIVNFLVLVWILKRFLYKPVLEVIARRRAGIEKTLADARGLQANAEKLREQYEGRLANWEKERQQARDALAAELEAERHRRLDALQAELQQQREKAREIEARHQADTLRELETVALQQGARFAARLLEQASGPDTQTRLVDLLIDKLPQLPAERIAALQKSYGSAKEIAVVSALPLGDDQRRRLKQALANILPDAAARFGQDRDLIAGVRITVGAWVLAANVRDELRGFAELTYE